MLKKILVRAGVSIAALQMIGCSKSTENLRMTADDKVQIKSRKIGDSRVFTPESFSTAADKLLGDTCKKHGTKEVSIQSLKGKEKENPKAFKAWGNKKYIPKMSLKSSTIDLGSCNFTDPEWGFYLRKIDPIEPLNPGWLFSLNFKNCTFGENCFTNNEHFKNVFFPERKVKAKFNFLTFENCNLSEKHLKALPPMIKSGASFIGSFKVFQDNPFKIDDVIEFFNALPKSFLLQESVFILPVHGGYNEDIKNKLEGIIEKLGIKNVSVHRWYIPDANSVEFYFPNKSGK